VEGGRRRLGRSAVEAGSAEEEALARRGGGWRHRPRRLAARWRQMKKAGVRWGWTRLGRRRGSVEVGTRCRRKRQRRGAGGGGPASHSCGREELRCDLRKVDG
jgi:hypothetical protein